MILVIAFSSSGTPRAKSQTSGDAHQTAAPPNQHQVEQYRAMVDEETRKLAAEQQRLQQAKTDAAMAAANVEAANPGQTNPYDNPYAPRPVQPTVTSAPSPEEVQKAALEMERKKKEFNSLFSSNVALTFRKDPGPGSEPVVPTAANPLPPSVSESGSTASGQEAARAGKRTEIKSASDAATDRDRSRNAQKDGSAEGKNYRIFEGTVLETVLTNRLNGSFVGPLNAMLATNVYSHDHQQLLIPQGSRVLGEVQKVNSLGQQRLAVTFHRLIMPDGYSVSLDQFRGLNQIGESGLRDQVNNHYLQIFGVSLAIGAIAGVEQAGANYGTMANGLDAYRQGAATSLAQSSLQILDRFLNILPTITIREGHRIKIYLTNDLNLPAYDRHRLPADL